MRALLWSKKALLTSKMLEWRNLYTYEVPVLGEIDIPAIQKALSDKLVQSSWGKLRWISGVKVSEGKKPETVLVEVCEGIAD